MKKTTSCFIIMIMSLLLFSCANENKESSNNTKTIIVSNNEVPITSTNVVEKEEVEVELITVKRFMEIYDLSPEDIGEINLQDMISEYQITEENVNSVDWKVEMEVYREESIFLKYNVAHMIYGKGRSATAEDDISSLKWLVMDNSNAMYTEDYIWDIENKKSYFSNGDITYDYSSAEIIKDLSEEQINQMIAGLVDMKMPEWERFSSVGGDNEEDYYWNLFLVLENGDVLAYSGCQPELSGPEGFYDWLQEVIRISGGK